MDGLDKEGKTRKTGTVNVLDDTSRVNGGHVDSGPYSRDLFPHSEVRF
jgi:hypothetical protein